MPPAFSIIPRKALMLGLLLSAFGAKQNLGAVTAGQSGSSSGGVEMSAAQAEPASLGRVAGSAAGESATVTGATSNTLVLNFRNAPLASIVNYFSDEGGFIVIVETRAEGAITLSCDQPVDRETAVNLLNTALNQIHCHASLDGRTLTIVDKNEATAYDIPVKTGNDPIAIPKTNDVATWIIPVRFIEAGSLLKDLSPFVSSQARLVSNEAGNAIVITDTQSSIRHLAKLIQAVDASAERETEIRIFHLKFANPSEVASELNLAFGNTTGSGNDTESPIGFDGGGGDFPFPAETGSTSSSQNDRIKKATQVSITSDARLQAVIVSAPSDLMIQIAALMDRLDVASSRDQNVFVYRLNNGDANQVAEVLQGLFQSSGAADSTTGSSQKSALQQRAANSSSTTTSSSTTKTAGATGGGSAGGGGGGGSSAIP